VDPQSCGTGPRSRTIQPRLFLSYSPFILVDQFSVASSTRFFKDGLWKYDLYSPAFLPAARRDGNKVKAGRGHTGRIARRHCRAASDCLFRAVGDDAQVHIAVRARLPTRVRTEKVKPPAMVALYPSLRNIAPAFGAGFALPQAGCLRSSFTWFI